MIIEEDEGYVTAREIAKSLIKVFEFEIDEVDESLR